MKFINVRDDDGTLTLVRVEEIKYVIETEGGKAFICMNTVKRKPFGIFTTDTFLEVCNKLSTAMKLKEID